MESEALKKLRIEFLEAVVKNMPEVEADVMWNWMKNPKALKKALAEALCPPKTNDSVFAQGYAREGLEDCKGQVGGFPHG